MRKQEKITIWPPYFDAGKTRREGRRVQKNLSMPSPKILEIQEAATKLGIDNQLIPEKGYPKTPWNKAGMLLAEKQGSKEQVINRLAKQMLKARNEAPKADAKNSR